MSDNYPNGMDKYKTDPRSPEYDSSKEDAYESEHCSRTSELIESMGEDGDTDRGYCDLIKAFADTLVEITYGNTDISQVEKFSLNDKLNDLRQYIDSYLPTVKYQLNNDIEMICADEATAWMESESE